MKILKVEHGMERKSHIDKYDEIHFIFIIFDRALIDLGPIEPMKFHNLGIKFFDDGTVRCVNQDGLNSTIQDLYTELKTKTKEERLMYRDNLLYSLESISRFKL